MNSIAVLLMVTYHIFTVSYAGPVKTKTKEILDENEVIYTGQHEIVKLYTSLVLMEELQQRIVFFIEADINDDGSKVDKGLYVIIDNSTTKLLDNCKDIAGDATGHVFFATKEGIYSYNQKERNAYKYGNIGESLISLAAENNTGVIYALSESSVLLKITENGKKFAVDNRVKHAREIKLDIFDNLYYFDEDKNLNVVVDQETKKIDGLPKNSTSLILVKPPLGVEGMFLIADDISLMVYPNGTSIKTGNTIRTQSKPTAYSFDGMVVLYFGHEKKIYEYNLVARIITGLFEGVSDWLKKNLSFF